MASWTDNGNLPGGFYPLWPARMREHVGWAVKEHAEKIFLFMGKRLLWYLLLRGSGVQYLLVSTSIIISGSKVLLKEASS